MENESSKQPLKIEPESIDFGCLKPGQGGNIALKVSGGPCDILGYGDHFKILPTNFGMEDTEIQMTLLPGSVGDLIWDNIVLKGENEEVSLLVTARWEEQETVITPPGPPPQPVPPPAPEERRWKGRKCSRCGKNFAYDLNSGTWEQCSCNWYEMGVNMGSYMVRELRSGIKYFPSYLQELWNVILGKEKW